METFIGVKLIQSVPMSRQEYVDYRGWTLPEDECGTDEGFLVEDIHGETQNDPRHKGYISWVPTQEFNRTYRPTTGLPFGMAIEAARAGKKIARTGWNGQNMFVVMMPALYLPPFNTQAPGPKVNDRTAKYIGEDVPLDCQPYFAMFNAQKQWIPGWVASQSDMIACDWIVL